ncbi:MAG: glycoside hydrolase family 3 protein [Lachnospiraceae bacterium]
MRLSDKPFYLNKEQEQWVIRTLESLSIEEKIGQLFCEALWNCTKEEEEEIFSEIQPGAVMFRPNKAENIKEFTERMQRKSKIPLLIAANFERGGNGGISDGTYYGTQMQVAATDDVVCGERLGEIAGAEGQALGFNWTFAPIIDIDYNCFSTVTNTRTYGSDPNKVIKMGKAYLRGAGNYNMACTIKHFPGDGMDFRDQHVVASVNTKSVEEWDATYGKVYKELIDAGCESVMTAHIKCPAYSKYFNPEIADRDIMPASLSYDLNVKLLREKLGFNGLIVSDDTHMAGFSVSMSRTKAVPYSIASGVDMFLFTINHKEDVDYMKKGVQNGIITPERLDEAVTRILALKAKVGLNQPAEQMTISEDVVACEKHKEWARECADKAITLVKDVDHRLPLTPQKYKRILICALEGEKAGRYDNNLQYEKFRGALRENGFEVNEMDLDYMPGIGKNGATISELKEKYDLILYFTGARTGYRVRWKSIVCGEIPSYVKDIPTMLVSFNSPYMLIDMPMVGTYINAYSESDYTREAVIEKMLGRSEFKGVSPVDPFCGMWDTAL